MIKKIKAFFKSVDEYVYRCREIGIKPFQTTVR